MQRKLAEQTNCVQVHKQASKVASILSQSFGNNPHSQEEEWGFLLIDARNAFNEMNRHPMLWTTRHEWPNGACFIFNCHKHWSILVIRGKEGPAVFIPSCTGVTQGDALSMFIHGLGLPPLIKQLQAKFSQVRQVWCADNAGAGGHFSLKFTNSSLDSVKWVLNVNTFQSHRRAHQ